MNTAPEPGWRGLAQGAAAAALGSALTLAAIYPGLMSLDSAVQFAQARGVLPLDDVHPPLMSLLWRVADRVVAGPGALFVLFVAGWWAGLAALFWQLPLRRGARWLALFAVGLWPATLLMLAHLWKDVAMSVALLLATALALAWRRRGHRGVRVLAFVLLAAACGFRHNGVFAALPILLWLCWPRPGVDRTPHRRALVFVALALLLVLVPGWLLRASGAARVQPWSVVAIWDLAALSIAADRVLLPPALVHGGLEIDDLRRAYVPWANPPLFDLDKIRLSFYQPLTRGESDALFDAWRAAVWRDPAAYVRHRARLARYLLFGFPASLPRELVFVPQRIVLDGVDFEIEPVDAGAWPWRAAEALRPTPLFAGASYLALALLALAWARRRDGPARELVTVLALSAWANALPLLLISGSAEFRYLTWTALAALVALAAAVLGAQRELR